MNVWSEKQAMAIAQHVDNVTVLILEHRDSDAFSRIQRRLMQEVHQNVLDLRLLLLRVPFGEDTTRLATQQAIRSLLDTLDTTLKALSSSLKGERVQLQPDDAIPLRSLRASDHQTLVLYTETDAETGNDSRADDDEAA